MQRYLCKHCNKAFILSTDIINYDCFISNNIVERIVDYYYETQKFYKKYLHEVLSFNKFKYTKSDDGAMGFHMCDVITGQTIDIVEDRQLDKLTKYFICYNYKARSRVMFIIVNMYSLYVFLIKKISQCFHHYR